MRPVLVRLSFSHYCRKVEWALQAAGIPYKARNVSFRMLADFEDLHPEGTVPVLAVDGERICGSSDIMAWLAQVADSDLYPEGVADDVRAWEAWADETIGPVTRRMAYRHIHAHPAGYTRNPALWALFRAGRPAILGILKYYKARRTEDSDPQELDAILRRTLDQLGPRPFLFGDAPSAADYATAALLQPVVRIHPDAHPSMQEVRAYIDRVRQPLRRGRRLARRERERYASWPITARR